MDYGNILSRAWNIVWNHKWLFILGFLAALGSSGGGSGDGGNSNFSFPASEDFGSQFPSDFSEIFTQIAPFVIALVCFFIILGIVLWLVRLVGEGGLIASVNRLEAGEKLTFSDGFAAGTKHLPSMLGLSLILYGPFLLVGLIFAGIGISFATTSFSGGADFLAEGLGLLAICLIPLACLLSIVGLVITFIYPMAQRGIIIEGLGVVDGIRRGWQVLRENFIEVFLLALIFLFLSIIIGIVTVIIVAPLALLFILPTFLAAMEGSAIFTAGTILLLIMASIGFIILAAAIGSFLRAFQSTAFTLGYHQWTGNAAVTISDF